MLPLQFIAIWPLLGKSFGDETCSMSLPLYDPRSCDYEAFQSDNVLLQANPPSDDNNFMISQSDYRRAWQDATKKNWKSAIPILREAAKSWKDEQVYIDLCACLINYGHTLERQDAKAIYDEAEINCKMALAWNAHSDIINENLESIRLSRQMRGISVEPKIRAGTFRGMKIKKLDVNAQNDNGKFRTSSTTLYKQHSELVKTLRIDPGPIDDGNLQFKMYNGSIFDPSDVILSLGEVYVEDNFISEEERRMLITIPERGLPYTDKSGNKGPKGTVHAGSLTTIGSQLSKEQRVVVARIRNRIINRANDLKGLDTSMWTNRQSIRAHATAFIRYIEHGKHEVHHDNDFINRCLSSSIVLNDDFEGGDFNLHTTKNMDEWNLKGFPIIGSVKGKAGRLALFLSSSMHSVSEVVSGNRDVFFVWCTCDKDAEYQLDDPLDPVDDRKPWVATS